MIRQQGDDLSRERMEVIGPGVFDVDLLRESILLFYKRAQEKRSQASQSGWSVSSVP